MKYFINKTFVLILVFSLVQIPLFWTKDITSERISYKNEAVTSVSSSYAGHQSVTGPVLVFPYIETYEEDILDKNGAYLRTELKNQRNEYTLLPENLAFENSMLVEERNLAIFMIPIFRTETTIIADFDWPDITNELSYKSGATVEWLPPYLTIPVSDQHGIKSISTFTWNNNNIYYKPGSKSLLFNGQGISAEVQADNKGGRAKVEITLALIGTEQFHNIPTAKQTTVSINSNWPHPQFTGTRLPDKREVNKEGFTANWNSNSLATNIHDLWEACNKMDDCNNIKAEGLGIKLIDPANFYIKVERALKYGFLFLAVTFIAFLLIEVLCNLEIHPVQYSMLGIAGGVFFLLLLSFAEHLGFTVAYGIAASACLILITYYVQGFIQSWKRTGIFSSLLAGLYGTLFTILQMEDAALLTGSILIFTLITAAMILTRRINWYQWQNKGDNTAT